MALSDLAARTVSIEYSHIYTDEHFGEEQISGASQYLRAANSLNPPSDFLGVVLIDDYNPTTHITTSEEVVEKLASIGARPDFVVLESHLVPLADEVLGAITRTRVAASYRRYIAGSAKLPCSLLTAAWYLMRLGIIKDTSPVQSASEKKWQPADAVVNVLPARYADVEKLTKNLLSATRHVAAVERIDTLFFQSGAAATSPAAVSATDEDAA